MEMWQIVGAIIAIAATFIIAYYFEKKRPFEKSRQQK